MAEKKSTVMARVQLTVEIDLQDAWGTECKLGQVEKQAREGAEAAIQHGLLIGYNHFAYDKDTKTVGRIIGTPRVLALIVDSDGLDKQRAEQWAQREAATAKKAQIDDVVAERNLLASYIFKLSAAAGLGLLGSQSELAGAVDVMEKLFAERDALRREEKTFGKIVEDVMAKVRDVCSPGDDVVEVVGRVVVERDALHATMIYIAEHLDGVGSRLAAAVRDMTPTALDDVKKADQRIFDYLCVLHDALKKCGVAAGALREHGIVADSEWPAVAEKVCEKLSTAIPVVVGKIMESVNKFGVPGEDVASVVQRIVSTRKMLIDAIVAVGHAGGIDDKEPIDTEAWDYYRGFKAALEGKSIDTTAESQDYYRGFGDSSLGTNVARAISILSQIEQKLRDGNHIIESGG